MEFFGFKIDVEICFNKRRMLTQGELKFRFTSKLQKFYGNFCTVLLKIVLSLRDSTHPI